MLIPLKQGLKPLKVEYLASPSPGLNVDSIKTRIETCRDTEHRVPTLRV